jgi:NTP pyrophosphatase (non-canonical NTP hydrolase)
MHSEVSEGVDGWFDADDKVPEFYAIEAELADCVIRIMDLAQARKWDVVTPITAEKSHEILIETTEKNNEYFSISKIHSALSKALEALRKPKEDESKEVGEALAECVARVFMFALVFKLKVVEALCAKAEMNKGREYKHGGKAF